MYGKIVKAFAIFCFVLVCLFTICLFFGCKSTKSLSDNRNRIIEYRELQGEIRDGETELAITGERISTDSREIADTSEELERQLNGIEESIRNSKTNEQELGEVLQLIRTREITTDKLIELGIKFN